MNYQEEEANRRDPEISYGYGEQPSNSMATASLVMGILAMMTGCCCYVGLVFGSLGILFALLSRVEGPMEGQARAGLILSGIVVAFILLILGAFAALLLSHSWWLYDPPIHHLPVYPDILVPDNLLKGVWPGGGIL